MKSSWEIQCSEDGDCPNRQYCYKLSKLCVDHILCSIYYRQEAQQFARDAAQCGPCINGYAAEVLLTGENSTLCKKIVYENDTIAEIDNTMKWMWIGIATLICFFIAITCIIGFFKQYLDKCKVTECTEKNNSEMSHNCEIIASAPPEELSPLKGYQSRYLLSFNNNKMDNNKFANAARITTPTWVYNRNFNSDNDEIDTPNEQGNVSQLAAINNNRDLNNSAQLSIELPELTIEHEDNTRNDSLIQDNSLPSDHDTSNHDSRDQSNDNERSPPGIRISNVLISQNIAMNVKVINGDEY